MEGINWYSIIVTVVLAILGYIVTYIRKRTEIINKASEFINTAEEEYNSSTKQGETKFKAVVSWLSDMVPAPLRPFITHEMIAKIVQQVFDQMAKFADKQLDRIVDKIVDKDDEPEDETPSDVVE